MIDYSNIQATEVSGSEPVTLVEAKSWLSGWEGIDDFDALLTTMIKGARIFLERYMNRDLIVKTRTFDVQCTGNCDSFYVDLWYTNSATDLTVNSLADDDTLTLLTAGTDYYLRGNSIRIGEGRYSISYKTVPPAIDENIKEAIKAEVVQRFANRGENDGDSGMSEVAKQKVSTYRIPVI